jgi:16S rRNA A1518/A1519 N6-dimethyltransferase RsmA/KsgA/DIM1 with predicted DNA glycosylase/AP lyase activity
MTVFTHFFSDPDFKFKIDRECYFPSPAVHGALVIFHLKSPAQWPGVRSAREFRSFVWQAFSSKRKLLTNSLQPKWSRDDTLAALRALGHPDTVRTWIFTVTAKPVCSLQWH